MYIRLKRLRRRRKSAGIIVSEPAYQAIELGNTARSLQDWQAASSAYRDAVVIDPSLRHIWIQLGNTLKEAGDLEGSGKAYAAAAALDKNDVEGLVRGGGIAQMQGQQHAALQMYLQALQRDPAHPDAFRALTDMLERATGLTREVIMTALRDSGFLADADASPRHAARIALQSAIHNAQTAHLPEAQIEALQNALREFGDDLGPEDSPDDDGQPAIVFDASDLLSYFDNARLPTGIQRVQIATISSALTDRKMSKVFVCSFSDSMDCWRQVPADRFVALCELAVESGDRTDPKWLKALAGLKITASVAQPFEFPRGALLINLGTSWWLQNYFLFVREAQRTRGVRYIPFVHDLIPIMTPEHCVQELTQDFITWALGAFHHADFFLVNSEATKRDLIKVAKRLGHDVDPNSVATIRLDADFRRENSTSAPISTLRKWGVQNGRFVLIVSTIESRKNHIGALDAWMELIQRHGVARVPKLVCVGNRGWLNDAVYDRLKAYPVLRNHVVMLSGLSDAELVLLYQTCRFTLYPSNYEGWGLPVTESLCYGKVPLISDGSSLPEAGGAFAVYFPVGSTKDLATAAERLIIDDDYLREREAVIAAGFRPRSWTDIAKQTSDEISSFCERIDDREPQDHRFPPIISGRYYPITRNRSTRIWRGLASAEMLRTGTGWWWPDDWGCWTKPEGGELALHVRKDMGAVRIYLRLQAPDIDTDYTLSFGGYAPSILSSLPAGANCWRAITIPADREADEITVQIKGSASVDLTERTGGLDKRMIAIGVVGLCICEADNILMRADLTEAIAFNSLDDLAFNREVYGIGA